MATSRLDILINAKNKASGELSKVDDQISGLSGAAGTAAKALGALAVSFSAIQVGRFAFDLTQAGAAADRLEGSFGALAQGVNVNADSMLASMRQASAGMISDTDLMLSANKAMMLGVASNADDMSKLLEVAAERGQSMGLTTSQAFNDIVTGIGRQSAMILDNLGIVIDVESAYADYATQLGKTADALTDAEKKQAFLNAAIAESDGVVDVAIDDVARLEAAWKNLREETGSFINQMTGPAVAAAADVLAGTNTYNELNKILDSTDKLSEARKEFYRISASSVVRAQGMDNGEKIIEYTELIKNLTAEIDAAYVAGRQMTAEGPGAYFAQLADSLGAWDPSVIGDAFDNADFSMAAPDVTPWQEVGAMVGELTEDFKNATIQSEIMAGRWQDAGATGAAMAGEFQQKLAGVVMKMKDAGMSAEEVQAAMGDVARELMRSGNEGTTAGAKISAGMGAASFAANHLIEGLKSVSSALASIGGEIVTAQSKFDDAFGAGTVTKLGTMNDALAESAEMSIEIGKAYGGGGPIATGINQLSGIASKLQSVFGIGDVAGINADDLLPREDAVNENARRLADIAVNGFKGQDWMGEFAAEAPNIFAQLSESSDPQGAAAQLLKDFQDGLLNGTDELIDREAAKDRVRRMIMGEQSTAELANSIASELQAEMGIAMGEAQAAAASVLGGGNAGTGEAIIAEVRAAEVRIKNAGGDAGKQWGNMFLATVQDGVPGELVAMLANLVTPFVQSSLTAQDSRGAAAATQ